MVVIWAYMSFFYFGTAFQVGEQIAHGTALHSMFHDIYQKSLHVAQALHCVELSWFIQCIFTEEVLQLVAFHVCLCVSKKTKYSSRCIFIKFSE